jgi:hypothetical protein
LLRSPHALDLVLGDARRRTSWAAKHNVIGTEELLDLPVAPPLPAELMLPGHELAVGPKQGSRPALHTVVQLPEVIEPWLALNDLLQDELPQRLEHLALVL